MATPSILCKTRTDYLNAAAFASVAKDCCTQAGPYDHTVRKPTKGSVLAYWHAEEGLKANNAMSETASTAQRLPIMTSSQRQHPPRRVDVSGGHPIGFEASLKRNGQADESSVAPQVSAVKCNAEQCATTENGSSIPPINSTVSPKIWIQSCTLPVRSRVK